MSTQSFPIIGVHLDLKYLMPRKDYLNRWLREIAAMGINTLLLEYEDKFPFEKYSFLCAEDAFTPDELWSFLRTARECGIHVIPLVQTLSHLEFALAHEELAHLRESPDILTQINPSNPDALKFVHDLIDEVLTYHQEDEYFHLGADETWFVGTNPNYSHEVETMGLPGYWAKHLRPYIDQVMKAGKRPLAWDDVFWKEPAVVESLDLPRDLILVSWDYSIGESGAKGNSLSRVDVYREAGFDVLGAPCLNWGVLTPMHDHVLENTTAWAGKAKRSHLSGLINTSWAVFHTPLPTQMPYIAATAELLKYDLKFWDEICQISFCQDFFGVKEEQFPSALRDLSLNWEQRVEGLGRPLTPVIYSYMDLILYFNSQERRMKNGVYPLNWKDVDFPEIYQQKITLLRGLNDQTEIAKKLDDLESAYTAAMAVLEEFVQRAPLHQEEAQLLACFAAMKHLHVRTLKYLLHHKGDGSELLLEFERQKPAIQTGLLPFYEPASVERLMQLWWEPTALALVRESVFRKD